MSIEHCRPNDKGILTIDTTPGDPEIRYNVVEVANIVDGTLKVKWTLACQ